MAWEIHQEYLKKRYVVSGCTCGCLLYLVSLVALVLVPLAVGFGSQSFWLKEKMYHDSPDVQFQHRLVAMVEGEGSVRPFQYLWTTSPTLNDLIPDDALTVPIVKARSEDINSDGFVDQVVLSLTFSLGTSQKHGVRRVAVAGFFDYKLHGAAKLDMDALAILDVSTALPASSLSVVGDLVLHQREALRVTNGYKKPYTDTPMWDETNGLDNVLIGKIVSAYEARNFTTRFDFGYPVWQSNLAYESSAATGAPSTFTLDMTVRVPSTLVYTIPATSEMVKRAWMQYLSILVVVWVFIRWARIFMFGQKLVASSVITDVAGKEHKY